MKLASIITAFALFAIACTSTTTTTTPAPTSDKSPTDKADSGAKASESSNPDKDKKKEEEEETETPTCADEATQQACGQCCAMDHQQGATVYMQALTQCVCDPNNCATECEATICAATPKNPDAACNKCFQEKQQNCGQALGQTCGADQDCMAFNQCLQQSCADKP